MQDTLTISRAREIWDYLSALSSRGKSDAIVICCSYDLRVCDHACELLDEGYSDTLVISGKSGYWTRHIYNEPEAQVFYQRAIANGIDSDRIILEREATNFGENIVFSKPLIPRAKTVTFVSKPNSLLRAKLTVDAQWPEIDCHVSAPEYGFPDGVSNLIGVFGVIDEMVGDIDRIRKYPALGFQAEHRLPDRIVRAWEQLRDAGFTRRLLPDESM